MSRPSWRCVRCEARILPPRKNSHMFVVAWNYIQKTNELDIDIKRIQDLKPDQVVTHLACKDLIPSGFSERIKHELGIPKEARHPLLR